MLDLFLKVGRVACLFSQSLQKFYDDKQPKLKLKDRKPENNGFRIYTLFFPHSLNLEAKIHQCIKYYTNWRIIPSAMTEWKSYSCVFFFFFESGKVSVIFENIFRMFFQTIALKGHLLYIYKNRSHVWPRVLNFHVSFQCFVFYLKENVLVSHFKKI